MALKSELGLMADGRKRGVYILSFSLGAVALPTGLIAVAHEGLLTGVVLVLAGMALLVRSLEYFWARALQLPLAADRVDSKSHSDCKSAAAQSPGGSLCPRVAPAIDPSQRRPRLSKVRSLRSVSRREGFQRHRPPARPRCRPLRVPKSRLRGRPRPARI